MDAAGRGGDRTYTYLVPDALTDLEPGEAVLVEFGRRQALGIVLAEAGNTVAEAGGSGLGLDGGPVASDAPGLKPIVARVRADGPLLPRLTLALAGEVAAHYLAPPALVLRAMLPPGLLERLELVAEVLPGSEEVVGGSGAGGPADPVVADLLGQLEKGPKPVRDLAGPDGRAGLLRRLRSLDSDGRISLEWTLLGAGAGPRYERWVRLTDAGRAAVAACRRGGCGGNDAADGAAARSAPGRCAARAGRRPDRWAARPRTCPATTAAGPSPVSCAAAWSRPRSASVRGCRWPRARRVGAEAGRRRPTCCRPSSRRSSGSARRSRRAIRVRCCWTGSRAAARPPSMSRPSPRRSRPAGRRSCSCRRSRSRCRWWIGCGRTSTHGSRSSIPAWATGSGRTSGGGSGRARSTSSSGRGWRSSRRWRTSG